MRCPTLKDLPPPPPGKTGWPWTEESPQLPDTMPDGRPWPKISIITPNYNYGRFLEETIRSVLLQGYPNLEYIIIDGGSTDNSVEIIKKYEPWLAYWVSEPDKGQANAINKGIERSTGLWIAYINSDDYYLPCAFSTIARATVHERKVITGHCYKVNELSQVIGVLKARVGNTVDLMYEWCEKVLIPQQSTFWSRIVVDKCGVFDESLNYSFDYEYWIRVSRFFSFHNTCKYISAFRMHTGSKTQDGEFDKENKTILERYMRIIGVRYVTHMVKSRRIWSINKVKYASPQMPVYARIYLLIQTALHYPPILVDKKTYYRLFRK